MPPGRCVFSIRAVLHPLFHVERGVAIMTTSEPYEFCLVLIGLAEMNKNQYFSNLIGFLRFIRNPVASPCSGQFAFSVSSTDCFGR